MKYLTRNGLICFVIFLGLILGCKEFERPLSEAELLSKERAEALSKLSFLSESERQYMLKHSDYVQSIKEGLIGIIFEFEAVKDDGGNINLSKLKVRLPLITNVFENAKLNAEASFARFKIMEVPPDFIEIDKSIKEQHQVYIEGLSKFLVAFQKQKLMERSETKKTLDSLLNFGETKKSDMKRLDDVVNKKRVKN